MQNHKKWILFLNWEDIINTIIASNPRSIVLGDYVVGFDGGFDTMLDFKFALVDLA